GVAEGDVVEADLRGRGGAGAGGAGEGAGAGGVGDHGLEVEDLEDAVEADQGGHDVDLDVGQGGDGGVEAGEQGGERDEGAELEGAADGEGAAEAVEHGGGEGRGEGEGGEQALPVHGLGDADVADAAGAAGEYGGVLAGAAGERGEHGAGDVEPLVGDGAHLAVELHFLAGDVLQAAGDELGGDDEQGDQGERGGGDGPGQVEHGRQDQDQADDVRDDRGQGPGDGLLGADDVAVEAADQRAGLGAHEERDGLALDGVEDLAAQVVDEGLADPGGVPPAGHAEGRLGDGQDRDRGGEGDDHGGLAGQDPVVDDQAQQQRVRDGDDGLGAGEREEQGQLGAVRRGLRDDPAHGAGPDLLAGHRGVTAEGPHDARATWVHDGVTSRACGGPEN